VVIHIWQDWGGRRSQGYDVTDPEKRELFEEALPDVIRMLTDIAKAMDIDLSERQSSVIDGKSEKVPPRELLN
jgi:hypothetical protein